MNQILATRITVEGGLERKKEILLAAFAVVDHEGKAGRVLLTPNTVFKNVKRGVPFEFPGGGFPLYRGVAGDFAVFHLQVWEVDEKSRRIASKIEEATKVVSGESALVQAFAAGIPAFSEAVGAVRLVAAGLAQALSRNKNDLLAEWPITFTALDLERSEPHVLTKKAENRHGVVVVELEVRPDVEAGVVPVAPPEPSDSLPDEVDPTEALVDTHLE